MHPPIASLRSSQRKQKNNLAVGSLSHAIANGPQSLPPANVFADLTLGSRTSIQTQSWKWWTFVPLYKPCLSWWAWLSPRSVCFCKSCTTLWLQSWLWHPRLHELRAFHSISASWLLPTIADTKPNVRKSNCCGTCRGPEKSIWITVASRRHAADRDATPSV